MLIVDDNSELRETLADILELAGFDVESAGGARKQLRGSKKDFLTLLS